jgi:hypothetical protein
MATEKWVAGSGAGLTWTTAVNAADVNSLANGSSVLSSVADIANGTALDMFADISIALGSVTAAAPNFIGVYIYPLNEDGTTYGDGQLASGTGAAKIPSATAWVGNISFPTGAAAIVGTLSRIALPPGSFRFVLYNQAGVTLASSGNTVKYRTYNRSVA